ncbi:transcription elongation factor, N-terminal family protein [Acinetobacter sp. 1564232]|nr:transcription elongation factor, N-terminal family protein [Acinetobacter sp. 1564232]
MKSNLITRSGHDKLVAELKQLWHEERPEITKKVNWAASLGDRSENADYQYNKQLLRKIDRRVRYLGKRLEELKIVDYSPEQDGKVYFGAWVEIENEEGEQKLYVLLELMKFMIITRSISRLSHLWLAHCSAKKLMMRLKYTRHLEKSCGISIQFAMKRQKTQKFK